MCKWRREVVVDGSDSNVCEKMLGFATPKWHYFVTSKLYRLCTTDVGSLFGMKGIVRWDMRGCSSWRGIRWHVWVGCLEKQSGSLLIYVVRGVRRLSTPVLTSRQSNWFYGIIYQFFFNFFEFLWTGFFSTSSSISVASWVDLAGHLHRVCCIVIVLTAHRRFCREDAQKTPRTGETPSPPLHLPQFHLGHRVVFPGKVPSGFCFEDFN